MMRKNILLKKIKCNSKAVLKMRMRNNWEKMKRKEKANKMKRKEKAKAKANRDNKSCKEKKLRNKTVKK